MKVSTFMKIVAAWNALLGAASLLIPQAASGNLGIPLNTFDLFVARTLGTILLTLGGMDWIVSSASASVVRRALWANLFMQIILRAIDTSSILNETIASSSAFGIGVHIVIIVGLVVYLVRWRSTSEQLTPA